MRRLHRKNLFDKVSFGFLILVLFLSAGCGARSARSTPTLEQTSTDTPIPTRTPLPTATATPTITPTPLPSANQVEFPLRVILYQPWQAGQWEGIMPLPEIGAYDSTDPQVLRQQVADMQKAHIQVGILPWSSQDSDAQITAILDASQDTGFLWAVMVETEKIGDPTSGQIALDLQHLQKTFGSQPNYLQLDRRMAVFVDTEEQDDSCGMASRWREGNSQGAYLVMQAIPNYQTCSGQPDHWMDLHPDTPIDPLLEDSYTLEAQSFGVYDLAAKQAALTKWGQNVAQMTSRKYDLEIIVSYNDFANHTNIEQAAGWAGAGQYYLDVLADNGQDYQAMLDKAMNSGDVILIGAGDIAACGSPGTKATADLLGLIPGTIFTAGDNAFASGSFSEYANCFDPTWGQYKSSIYPAVGSTDYQAPYAAPYFQYFGERAGDPDKGYYSLDAGTWHVVVLNSQCSAVGGCGEGSPQLEWLKQDLDASQAKCTLAIWNAPLYSSGQHGGSATVRPFWQVLYDAGAEIVVNARDLDYERFALMDPFGALDEDKGIREFVVGTGGGGVRPLKDLQPNSEFNITYTYGVLKLTLKDEAYAWEFVPQAGMGATDSGTGGCH